MFCPKCGKAVKDGHEFCMGCGTKIERGDENCSEITTSTVLAKGSKPKRKMIVPIIIVLVIIVGSIGTYFGYQILNGQGINKNIEYYSLFPEVPTVNNIMENLEDYSVTKAGTCRYSHDSISKTDLGIYRDYLVKNGFTATEPVEMSSGLFGDQYYFNFESKKTGTKYYACLIDIRNGKGFQLELAEGTLD